MTKKRKKVTVKPTVLAHFARANGYTETTRKQRGGGVTVKRRPSAVVDVFVLAPSVDEVHSWLAGDRYGLTKRGFQLVMCYALTPLGGPGRVQTQEQIVEVNLPLCGCYETAQWLYIKESDAEEK